MATNYGDAHISGLVESIDVAISCHTDLLFRHAKIVCHISHGPMGSLPVAGSRTAVTERLKTLTWFPFNLA